MNRFLRGISILLVVAAIFVAFAIEGKNTSAYAENFEIGSYVTFGTYPQTAEGTDETPIEWLVLAQDGDNVLLLSRYCLDSQRYNTSYDDMTWEMCTLRTWLNDDFINCAFTSEEQSAILLTNVDNSSSQRYWSTDGGNDTQDKIFLLSYAEANEYLGVTFGDSSNIQSRVAPTAYAIAQGAYTSDDYKTADGEAAGAWWLRSPGYYQDDASEVRCDGSLNSTRVSHTFYCVRPALWVNLESGTF